MKRSIRMKKEIFVVLLALLLPAMAVFAQEAAPVPAPAETPTPATETVAATAAAQETPLFSESFLFSSVDVISILRALEGRTSFPNPPGGASNIPLKRVISVAGVLYRGPGDWTVWINGKKITPKQLLPEIMDIKVSQDRVMLNWFDIGLNGIITIEMRPHQTYDIVTGVMLPG